MIPDPARYIQEPVKTVEIDGRTHYIYACDDASECDGRARSPPRKTKLRRGYSWVCGDCRGNFM